MPKKENSSNITDINSDPLISEALAEAYEDFKEFKLKVNKQLSISMELLKKEPWRYKYDYIDEFALKAQGVINSLPTENLNNSEIFELLRKKILRQNLDLFPWKISLYKVKENKIIFEEYLTAQTASKVCQRFLTKEPIPSVIPRTDSKLVHSARVNPDTIFLPAEDGIYLAFSILCTALEILSDDEIITYSKLKYKYFDSNADNGQFILKTNEEDKIDVLVSDINKLGHTIFTLFEPLKDNRFEVFIKDFKSLIAGAHYSFFTLDPSFYDIDPLFCAEEIPVFDSNGNLSHKDYVLPPFSDFPRKISKHSITKTPSDEEELDALISRREIAAYDELISLCYVTTNQNDNYKPYQNRYESDLVVRDPSLLTPKFNRLSDLLHHDIIIRPNDEEIHEIRKKILKLK